MNFCSSRILLLTLVCLSISYTWCQASEPATPPPVAGATSLYTDAMFRTAMKTGDGSLLFALFTVVDDHSGQTRMVCRPPSSITSALLKESGFDAGQADMTTAKYEAKIKEIDDQVLGNESRVYHFPRLEVLDEYFPVRDQGILKEVRNQLAAFSEAELRDPTALVPVYMYRSGKGSGEYKFATIQVLLEHGILCGIADVTGAVFVLPQNPEDK